MLGQQRAPPLHPPLRYHAVEVLLEGQRELGLTAVELDHARYRRHAAQSRVKRDRANAAGEGLGADPVEPGREIALGGVPGSRRSGGQGNEQGKVPHREAATISRPEPAPRHAAGPGRSALVRPSTR